MPSPTATSSLLLDHRGVDAGSTPDDFELALLQGEFAGGTDFASASAGQGEFTITPDSFLPDGVTPKVSFDDAVYSATEVVASGGTFDTAFPFGPTCETKRRSSSPEA